MKLIEQRQYPVYKVKRANACICYFLAIQLGVIMKFMKWHHHEVREVASHYHFTFTFTFSLLWTNVTTPYSQWYHYFRMNKSRNAHCSTNSRYKTTMTLSKGNMMPLLMCYTQNCHTSKHTRYPADVRGPWPFNAIFSFSKICT